MAKQPVVSRARWSKSKYFRKRDGTWRDKKGMVYSSATSQRPIRNEPRYGHSYGGDSKKGLFTAQTKRNFVYREKPGRYVKINSRARGR